MYVLVFTLSIISAIGAYTVINTNDKVVDSSTATAEYSAKTVKESMETLRGLYLEARDNPLSACGSGTIDFSSCPSLFSSYTPTPSGQNAGDYTAGSNVPPELLNSKETNKCQVSNPRANTNRNDPDFRPNRLADGSCPTTYCLLTNGGVANSGPNCGNNGEAGAAQFEVYYEPIPNNCKKADGSLIPPSNTGGCPAGSTAVFEPASYPETYGDEVPTSAQNPPVCRYIGECQNKAVYSGFTRSGVLGLSASAPSATYPNYCQYRITYLKEYVGTCAESTSMGAGSFPQRPYTNEEICSMPEGPVAGDPNSKVNVLDIEGPEFNYCSAFTTRFIQQYRVQNTTLGLNNTDYISYPNPVTGEVDLFTTQAACDAAMLGPNGVITRGRDPAGGSLQANERRCASTAGTCREWNRPWTQNPLDPDDGPQQVGCEPDGSGLLGGIVGGLVDVVGIVTGNNPPPNPEAFTRAPTPDETGTGETFQAIYYLDPNKLLFNVQNSLTTAGELPRPVGMDWVREIDGSIKYIVPTTQANIDPQGFRDVWVCMTADTSGSGRKVSNTTTSGKALINAVKDLNTRYETMDQNCNVPGECKVQLVKLNAAGQCDPENAEWWEPSDSLDEVALIWNIGQIKPKATCVNATESRAPDANGNCLPGFTREDWKSRIFN